VEIAARLDAIGFDAFVPVVTSTFWDMSIVRGEYPDRAWGMEGFQDGYAEAFGSRYRARAVAALNRLQARRFDFEPAWNERFCRRVRERVDGPVLAEGGIRERGQMDRLLGADGGQPACDAVGMARPFYAEPRLSARLLDADASSRVLCESCNNCTVPQATGAPGVCRTPEILRRHGELRQQGAYEREES